jgi:hypothetical protein
MHFEILIEDISGKRALEILIPKILNGEQSYRIISYKGIGHIPKGMKRRKDVDIRSRLLLNKLPHLIQGLCQGLCQKVIVPSGSTFFNCLKRGHSVEKR